jgi:hypothetical protein
MQPRWLFRGEPLIDTRLFAIPERSLNGRTLQLLGSRRCNWPAVRGPAARLGILCITVNERIAGIMKTRSKTLREGIRGLLDGQPNGNTQFRDAFYLHPLISGMMHRAPSFLSGQPHLSTAIVDLILSNPHDYRPGDPGKPGRRH